VEQQSAYLQACTVTVSMIIARGRRCQPAPAAELRITWIASAGLLCVRTTVLIVFIATQTTITVLLLRPLLPAAAADLRIPRIASAEVLYVSTTVLIVFIATQTTITVLLLCPFLPAPAADLRI